MSMGVGWGLWGSGVAVVRRKFGAHGFDLSFQGDVFLLLARQVVAGELQFYGYTFRGEAVGVLELALRAQEVAGLDVAFVERGLQGTSPL
ncbi:MAG: hypothetical protein Q8M09_19630 [Pseudomonadota bacterium]|nr:hypothetical protein [Pseudomonadota bacterium]MDP2351254.1 hypothetical protein [Pseudomonadota bacterium]